METNPYQSPPPLPDEKILSGFDEKLTLLVFHRYMMLLAVTRLAMDFSWGILLESFGSVVLLGIVPIYVIVTVLMAYTTYRVVKVLVDYRLALVSVLFALAPCFGLIAVLLANGHAIDRLRKLGVHVGLMGATNQQIHAILRETQERTKQTP